MCVFLLYIYMKKECPIPVMTSAWENHRQPETLNYKFNYFSRMY